MGCGWGLLCDHATEYLADRAGAARAHRGRPAVVVRRRAVAVVGDDCGVVAGSTSKTATISSLLLQVGDDGTFGHHTCRDKILNLNTHLIKND